MNLNTAIETCHRYGYTLRLPQSEMDYETVAHFCARLGISKTHFWRRTRERNCPGFLRKTGKTCVVRRPYIRELRSNPLLEQFMEKRRKINPEENI